MELINEVFWKISPLAARYGFEISAVDLVGWSASGQFRRIEFHAMLPSGGLRLFGLYERPADQVFVAQLWSLNDHGGSVEGSAPAPVTSYRREWTYDAGCDVKTLAGEIVGVVAGWLDSDGSTQPF